jgi:hypothetical protein
MYDTGFPATDRDAELAGELLDVVNASELETFLRRLAGPAAGRALHGVLRRTAERTLPTVTTGAPGASAANTAARVFGLELEGMSAEDRDYEIARQFVRFARAAAAHAARAPAGEAVARAGRAFAPGL